MKSLERFKSLSYAKYFYTEGRIVLVDVPLDVCRRKQMENLKTSNGEGLFFLDTKQLSEDLEKFLEKIIEKEKNVLFVFPGNGSNYPKSVSKICKESVGTGVYAKRIWVPGSDPIAIAGTIMPEFFLNLTVQAIIVVDDVISSGQTMYKLYRNNAWRFPRAKWVAATWISQVPQMRAPSGINGYDRTVIACVIEGPGGKKVPINSLSTLREQPDIAENYARRHFLNPGDFLFSNKCVVNLGSISYAPFLLY